MIRWANGLRIRRAIGLASSAWSVGRQQASVLALALLGHHVDARDFHLDVAAVVDAQVAGAWQRGSAQVKTPYIHVCIYIYIYTYIYTYV